MLNSHAVGKGYLPVLKYWGGSVVSWQMSVASCQETAPPEKILSKAVYSFWLFISCEQNTGSLASLGMTGC